MKIKQSSFTLIEILVVIVIIGLLAGITLVSIQGIRKRARIANGLQFSASVYHALGANAVGIWDFNDKTFKDKSGNGNNGNCQGCSESDWSDEGDTPNGEGYALNFDGNDNCIEIEDSFNLDGMDAITIEFWINRDNNKNKQKFVSKEYSYEFGYEGHISDPNKRELSFKVKREGNNSEAKVNNINISFGRWHYLAATSDGFSTIRMFLDGKELFLNDKDDIGNGVMKTSNENLYLGCRKLDSGGNPEELYFGIMDEVKIYGESLSSAQIKQRYVKGAKKRGLLVKE